MRFHLRRASVSLTEKVSFTFLAASCSLQSEFFCPCLFCADLGETLCNLFSWRWTLAKTEQQERTPNIMQGASPAESWRNAREWEGRKGKAGFQRATIWRKRLLQPTNLSLTRRAETRSLTIILGTMVTGCLEREDCLLGHCFSEGTARLICQFRRGSLPLTARCLAGSQYIPSRDKENSAGQTC